VDNVENLTPLEKNQLSLFECRIRRERNNLYSDLALEYLRRRSFTDRETSQSIYCGL